MPEIHETGNFAAWIRSLRDGQARARIAARIQRQSRAAIILLCGGDKRRQDTDIALAKMLAKELG
jgi:putative component of toxin-antitoxin plasmid stabilization module